MKKINIKSVIIVKEDSYQSHLFAVTYSPHLVSSQVLQQLCRLWACARGCGPLLRLVSARNVMLLCQGGASQARLAWAHLSSVLVELLKAGLVTPAQLETQFIALLRLTWPPVR